MTNRRPRKRTPRGIALRELPAAPLAIGLGGLLAAVSTALPWYAPNLAPVFTELSVTGLSGRLGPAPRVVLVLAVLLLVLGGALTADEHGSYPLDRRLAWRLTVAATCIAAAAAMLVIYRLAVLPDPADFYARRYGLYLTAIGVAAALTGAITQVMRRSG